MNKWLIISVGVYITLVLNLLEPFGITINSFMMVYHLMLASYGVVSVLTVAVICYGFGGLKKYESILTKQWKTISWLIFLVVMVSFSNWLYSQLIHYTISGWHNMYVPVRGFFELMPQFIAIYAIWGLVSWAVIFATQYSLSLVAKEQQYLDQPITLQSDNQSDHLKLKQKHIVCFKTCDNYLEVYYLNESAELQQRMIRSSMKKMSEQLNADNFYRPHQSYLVNLTHIKGLKKIKNSHFLEVAYLNFDVAVSRSNVKKIKSFIVT